MKPSPPERSVALGNRYVNGYQKAAKQPVGLKLALAVLSFLIPTCTTRPALSAEQVRLSYGSLQRSIPVSSLQTFAKTGRIDDALAAYARYAKPQQLTQLRQLFLSQIPLNAVQVSQFLYTPIGERLLERLGEVIRTDAHLGGFYAIRASLILAAADPQGFTVLNALRKFPSRAIEINLVRSLEIAESLATLVNRTNQAVMLINQQAALEATTAHLSPANLEHPGSFRWKKQTIALNDCTRNRSLPTDIYLPLSATPRPIIIISHGLGSDRSSFAYLAQHLASYGFVVAVPQHSGSDAKHLQALLAGRASEVTSPREFIDRPLDIKYVLDALDRLSRSDAAWQGRLNLQQVGVFGQSYGGYTALALAGGKINFQQLRTSCRAANDSLNLSLLLQCLALKLPQQQYNLSESRVKAVLAVNPVDSSIMGQAGLSQIQIPTMIVAGSADTVAPALPEQIQPFTWLITPNKYLVLINGGTHFSTIAESPNAAVPIPDSVIGSSPALARLYIRALSVAFFQAYVAKQTTYQQYLSAAYANVIDRNSLPLSLVRSLTADQLTHSLNQSASPSTVVELTSAIKHR